jgi:protocatechuate 3,4-dioxygenase, alpha subunit
MTNAIKAAPPMRVLQNSFGQTPSQTVGPYFAYGLTAEQYRYNFSQVFNHQIALPQAAGQHIRVEGQVFDGNGALVTDAMIEVLQADASGQYVSNLEQAQAAGFRGFGRCGTGTDPQARYYFDTVKPGADAAGHAPHLNLIVTMRGMLLHAFTRVYFNDETAANAQDPVLQSVPAARRATLVAQRQDTSTGAGALYRFNVHMQGSAETVFFDL